MRGDEVFGRRITISYFRDQTEEEAEVERRYADAAREAKERELARLQAELGVVCYAARGSAGNSVSSLRPQAARKFSASPFMQ